MASVRMLLVYHHLNHIFMLLLTQNFHMAIEIRISRAYSIECIATMLYYIAIYLSMYITSLSVMETIHT